MLQEHNVITPALTFCISFSEVEDRQVLVLKHNRFRAAKQDYNTGANRTKFKNLSHATACEMLQAFLALGAKKVLIYVNKGEYYDLVAFLKGNLVVVDYYTA